MILQRRNMELSAMCGNSGDSDGDPSMPFMIRNVVLHKGSGGLSWDPEGHLTFLES